MTQILDKFKEATRHPNWDVQKDLYMGSANGQIVNILELRAVSVATTQLSHYVKA